MNEKNSLHNFLEQPVNRSFDLRINFLPSNCLQDFDDSQIYYMLSCP